MVFARITSVEFWSTVNLREYETEVVSEHSTLKCTGRGVRRWPRDRHTNEHSSMVAFSNPTNSTIRSSLSGADAFPGPWVGSGGHKNTTMYITRSGILCPPPAFVLAETCARPWKSYFVPTLEVAA